MATAPSSSCCEKTRIYQIKSTIPKKNIHFTPSVLTICLPRCPSALRAQSVWACRRTCIVVVMSPIVVDPQLPPLLHLLHPEVLVVAGLVVVTRVVVVVRAIIWAVHVV